MTWRRVHSGWKFRAKRLWSGCVSARLVMQIENCMTKAQNKESNCDQGVKNSRIARARTS